MRGQAGWKSLLKKRREEEEADREEEKLFRNTSRRLGSIEERSLEEI